MATMRGYYREELERANNNIEMALTHLARIVDAYSQAHPDISEAVKACGDGLVIIAETIQQIHDEI